MKQLAVACKIPQALRLPLQLRVPSEKQNKRERKASKKDLGVKGASQSNPPWHRDRTVMHPRNKASGSYGGGESNQQPQRSRANCMLPAGRPLPPTPHTPKAGRRLTRPTELVHPIVAVPQVVVRKGVSEENRKTRTKGRWKEVGGGRRKKTADNSSKEQKTRPNPNR